MIDVLLFPIIFVVIGFAILAWSADLFVTGAAAFANNMGISPLIIGLTVVGLGTSAPEIIVAALSSLQGKPDIAVGNAIGSNIANIALILGITALLSPIAVKANIIRRELPLLLLVTFFAVLLLSNQYLSRLDGVLLLLALFAVLYWIKQQKPSNDDNSSDIDFVTGISMPKAALFTLAGISLMLLSSHYIVEGAVSIAKYMGISDLVIGLTIVAIGTSLPELAASIAAVRKNVHDLAIGNVIGSNMFNLLAVLSVPALMQPTATPAALLYRDIPVMVGLTLALCFMSYGFKGKQGHINRLEGGMLFSVFIAYGVYLYITIS